MEKKAFQIFLENAPLGWTLIREVEVELLSRLDLSRPLLDIGCGTGLFAKALLKARGQKKLDIGLDLSEKETSEASKLKVYRKLVVSDVHDMPFDDGKFQTVLSNGTLEHVDNIDSAIHEIARVLRKKGRLIFTCPSHLFSEYLFFGFFPFYTKAFNAIFGHKNLFSHKKWGKVLSKSGLEVIDYQYYNPKRQIVLHELLTFFSAPEQISKNIFGSWVIFPALKKMFLKLGKLVIETLYTNETSKSTGGSILIVAEKK